MVRARFLTPLVKTRAAFGMTLIKMRAKLIP